jgi:hypothetical protein
MTLTDIFSYIFGFLCVYIFLYILLGFFFKDSSHEEFQKSLSRSIDIFMAVVVLTIGITLFFTLPFLGQEPSIISQTLQEQIVTFLENPMSILIVSFVILLLYVIIYLFRIPMTPSTKPFTIILLESGSWVLLAILVIENVIRTFFKIDLVDSFVQFLDDIFSLNPTNPVVLPNTTSNSTNPVNLATPINNNEDSLFSSSNQSNVVISNEPNPFVTPITTTSITTNITNLPVDIHPNTSANIAQNDSKKEVFNIAGNKFTYEDAPVVCASYGAELANYEQIEEAYENGAEWCNYGWSAEQMAFFPTQKETWKKLQKNPATAHRCGRPGVNGGYMPDANITFGVNCYGVKPPMTTNDQMAMQQNTQLLSQPTQPTPLTPEEVAFNQKLQYWKENAAQILTINGFNENKWSEY